MLRIFSFVLLAATLILPGKTSADADGPDFFRITGVASDDVLNIRTGPGASHDKIGTIPHNAGGVRNLGCQGGLSYAEWAEASQAERDAANKRRWCQIEFGGVKGWVAGRYLAEDSAGQVSHSPSFDCSKASGDAEQAVCADAHLARLDRELARLYKLAVNGSNTGAERLGELKAMQRGWIKGRNDCWKETDNLRACVASNYVMRIDEIRTGYADARSNDSAGISIGPLAYGCDGFDAFVSLVAVNADPSMLSLRWRDNWITPIARPSASGASYAAQTADGFFGFWVKGDEALFSRPGQPDLNCKRAETG